MDKTKKHTRKQHFVPQFYLAGFTQSGDKNGFLNVIDKLKAGIRVIKGN